MLPQPPNSCHKPAEKQLGLFAHTGIFSLSLNGDKGIARVLLHLNILDDDKYDSTQPARHKPAHTMLSALQNPRHLAAQVLNFGLVLSTAFMVRNAPR